MLTHKLLIVATVLATACAAPAATHFNNILVIILENFNYKTANADPNIQAFGKQGIQFSNWFAITHPSQGNYIGLTSGSTNGVTSDSPVVLNVRNVVDLLEEKGLTWITYQENYPGKCFTGATASGGLYAAKHNPFISYADIRNNPTRCAKIVPGTQLQQDLNNNKLYNFAFFTPNMHDDGHDSSITVAGKWLKDFLASTQVTSHYDAVLLTVDESQPDNDGNHVWAGIAGKAVTRHGVVDSTRLNHYSLLKTLEQNFGLGNLGKNDVTATPFSIA